MSNNQFWTFEDAYNLCMQYPIAINMRIHHVKLCLEEARQLLIKNKTLQVMWLIRMAEEGLDELDYILKRRKHTIKDCQDDLKKLEKQNCTPS